jgi:hypothetical protein
VLMEVITGHCRAFLKDSRLPTIPVLLDGPNVPSQFATDAVTSSSVSHPVPAGSGYPYKSRYFERRPPLPMISFAAERLNVALATRRSK